MEIKSNRKGDVLVIKLSGELMGGSEAVNFYSLLYQSIEQDVVKIVVDMQQVNWMNSSGLGMLVSGLTTARSSGGDLKLANLSPRVRRPLEITRLENVFEIYESVDDAIRSFSK